MTKNQVTRIKVKTKKRVKKNPKDFDATSKRLGIEPKVDANTMEKLTPEQRQEHLSKAYTWYGYFHSRRDIIFWLTDHMVKTGWSTDDIAKIKALAPWQVAPRSIIFLAHMQDTGLVLTAEEKTRFDGHIRNLFTVEAKLVDNRMLIGDDANPEDDKKRPTISIQDRVAAKEQYFLAEIEGIQDDAIDPKIGLTEKFVNFRTYDWFIKNEVRSATAAKIAMMKRPLLEELTDAISGKDLEMVENYSNFTKLSLRAYHSFIANMIEDAETYAGNQKRAKAPRKARPISVEKLVRNVKFQKADLALKIQSINPVRLIGAKRVWIYNTKSAVLQVYIAEEKNDLTVKGTKLIGWDDKVSYQKKLRKPEAALPTVTNESVRGVDKFVDALTTIRKIVTGRLNEQSVILRVA